MNDFIGVLKKYAVFKGRAGRKEYWTFILVNIVVSFALGYVDQLVGSYNAEAGIGTIGMVYAVAVLVPTLAVSVRRLHDTDKVGWWAFLSIVPLGVIVLLIMQAFEGTKGTNRFGPDPREHQAKSSTFSG